MNKIFNSSSTINQYNTLESSLTKTWNGLKVVSQKGIECVSTTTGYVKSGVVKGLDLTQQAAKTISQNTAAAGNLLFKATVKGVDATTNAGMIAATSLNSTLFKSKDFFIQNKELYLKELGGIGVNNLLFFSLGVIANEIIREPLLSYLDSSGFRSAPDLPEPLYNFSRNVAILESSLPSDRNNIARLLINRPLFFGTLLFGLTQEGLLKQLPEKILKRVSPNHVSFANSKIAKVARVCFVAALYSLSTSLNFVPKSIFPDFLRSELNHLTNHITHSVLMWKFALGLALGSIQEITGNPFYVMSTLSGINLKYTIKDIHDKRPFVLPEYNR